MAAKQAKKEETSKAVTVPVDSAVPAHLQGYKGYRGTEGIENKDITIPRIKIGQSMSAEVKDGEIEEGTLFLNISGEVLAEPGAPLLFVPILYGKEYILWRPRKDNGGGILARAKPVQDGVNGVRYAWDKPNTTFEVKVEGKIPVKWTTKNFIDEDHLDEWGSEIPGDMDSSIAATLHYNYVVMLPEFGNMMAAISCSRTAVSPAKDFNSLLTRSESPIFSRLFKVTTWEDSRDNNKFRNFKFTPAGYAPVEAFQNVYEPMALQFASKKFDIDHSDGEETTTDDRA